MKPQPNNLIVWAKDRRAAAANFSDIAGMGPPMDDNNTPVIEEIRANGGAVNQAMGGFFRGKPPLILHHTGARTGKLRTNPHARLVAIMGQFADYEKMTDRGIAAVVLDRAD